MMRRDPSIRNPKCRLGYWPDNSEKCNPGECGRCGWHLPVEEERKARLRKKLKGYIIKQEGGIYKCLPKPTTM